MKLYDSLGPNPRLVRMFVAEKGIEIEKVPVDLMAGENRKAPYTDKNPYGQLPSLELDDGTVLAETTVICEYLEELNPEPSLLGSTPEERAVTRMWTRRGTLSVIEPMGMGFRYAEGLPLFKERIRTIPQAADDLKALAQDGLSKLDGLIGAGPWLCGDRFSLADINLFAFLAFGASVGQPIGAEYANVQAWFDRCAARPSAAASE